MLKSCLCPVCTNNVLPSSVQMLPLSRWLFYLLLKLFTDLHLTDMTNALDQMSNVRIDGKDLLTAENNTQTCWFVQMKPDWPTATTGRATDMLSLSLNTFTVNVSQHVWCESGISMIHVCGWNKRKTINPSPPISRPHSCLCRSDTPAGLPVKAPSHHQSPRGCRKETKGDFLSLYGESLHFLPVRS